MTKAEFLEICDGAREDAEADGMNMQDCAVDIADCLLHDVDILAFARKEWPHTTREGLKFIVAEYIVG